MLKKNVFMYQEVHSNSYGDTMKPKVLFVDDDRSYHNQWKVELEEDIIMLSAFSIDDAERLFVKNPDIVAIVMDACVPGHSITTLPLTQKFRSSFSGPMIASSGSPELRKQLMEAGCDHESGKGHVPIKLTEILGL